MIDKHLFDKTRNDEFKELNHNQLYKLIKNKKIEFYDSLDIDSKMTFGLEIECEGINTNKLGKFIVINDFNWDLKDDKSLEKGVEIISPVLKDNPDSWQDLKIICDYIKRKGANVHKNAGGHIHVGAHTLSYDVNNWINFLIFYSLYEDVIYKFCYGDSGKPRKHIKLYAKPISDILKYRILSNKIYDIGDLQRPLQLLGKHKGINFENIMFDDITNNKDKNTIEFRFPNSSKRKETWQNNVNMITKLVMHSILETDQEYLFWLLKNKREYYSSDYVKPNFERAIYFVDEIFDNNLDKTNFLKQYIK